MIRPATHSDIDPLRRLIDASLALDRASLDGRNLDATLAHIAADPSGTAVRVEGRVLVGFVTPALAQLAVHPGHRRRGHGRRLVEAGRAIERRRGRPELILHVPAASETFATRAGLRYHASLWTFRLPADTRVPEPRFPSDVATRPLRRFDDVPALSRLLNESFADHPSPLSFSEEELLRAHGRPDFDASTMLVVHPIGDPWDLVGFVRTVVIDGAGGGREGEIRLVCVLREWRGRGIGLALMGWGIGTLRSRGVASVTLDVESRNEHALGIYRRLGFEQEAEWQQWSTPA